MEAQDGTASSLPPDVHYEDICVDNIETAMLPKDIPVYIIVTMKKCLWQECEKNVATRWKLWIRKQKRDSFGNGDEKHETRSIQANRRMCE